MARSRRYEEDCTTDRQITRCTRSRLVTIPYRPTPTTQTATA